MYMHSFLNMSSFYLNLTSKSSLYKANTASSFIVQLQPEIKLQGRWKCALVELFLPEKTTLKPKYITTNFIQSSVVGESRHKLLRMVYEGKRHITFSPEYLEVTDNVLDSLQFEIADDSGILKLTGETHIRLHFQKQPC